WRNAEEVQRMAPGHGPDETDIIALFADIRHFRIGELTDLLILCIAQEFITKSNSIEYAIIHGSRPFIGGIPGDELDRVQGIAPTPGIHCFIGRQFRYIEVDTQVSIGGPSGKIGIAISL